jgi:hypothetical protein
MRSKEDKPAASRIVWKGLDVTRVNSTSEAVSTYRLELLRKIVKVPYRGQNLRIVAFSDWRVQEIVALIRFLRAHKKPDLIVYAGDDIRRFRPPQKIISKKWRS